MSRSPKYIGGREKSSAAQTQEFIAASLEASPTAGGNMATPRGKTKDDSYIPTDKEKTNAPELPSEFRQHKTDWLKIANFVFAMIGGLAVIGGVFFWFAKLDAKVDATASDVVAIKPKVDQLIINSEKHEIRINNLDNNQFSRKKERSNN